MAVHYQKPTWYHLHVQDPVLRFFMRMGISVWGSRVLRVRGRTSGDWHNTPVNLLTIDKTQYLVAPRGHTQWVRNIRVSGEGELVLGGHAQRFKAVEIPEDQRVPILREYLKRWAFEVGMFFGGVGATSSDKDLRRIAPDHPVFRVDPIV